ncbi:MAG: response regulator [Oscillospiraceae bacterium]|jgi:CheY-like chemotaxis protein|nr:response regulator [Oscillospiraceae bacterium]
MDQNMHILIVSQTESFLLTSIIKRLSDEGYTISPVLADIEAINAVKGPLSGTLIYADENLLEQNQALTFLKDRVIADDIPVFAVGEAESLKGIKEIIPKDVISREFARPLHVNNLTDTVSNMIKQARLQGKKKILVVDDSGAMLRNIKGWLGNKYNLILANSAAMAIKYITLNRPDLVLLDYDMPVVDGKQVLEMIRTETEFTKIPVIFLTALEDKESFLKVMELKPEGYLLKSMPPFQIVKAIDDFFAGRRV